MATHVQDLPIAALEVTWLPWRHHQASRRPAFCFLLGIDVFSHFLTKFNQNMASDRFEAARGHLFDQNLWKISKSQRAGFHGMGGLMTSFFPRICGP
jgi:hypothetical protein